MNIVLIVFSCSLINIPHFFIYEPLPQNNNVTHKAVFNLTGMCRMFLVRFAIPGMDPRFLEGGFEYTKGVRFLHFIRFSIMILKWFGPRGWL